MHLEGFSTIGILIYAFRYSDHFHVFFLKYKYSRFSWPFQFKTVKLFFSESFLTTFEISFKLTNLINVVQSYVNFKNYVFRIFYIFIVKNLKYANLELMCIGGDNTQFPKSCEVLIKLFKRKI